MLAHSSYQEKRLIEILIFKLRKSASQRGVFFMDHQVLTLPLFSFELFCMFINSFISLLALTATRYCSARDDTAFRDKLARVHGSHK